jgi:CRISPR-associated protein Cas5h
MQILIVHEQTLINPTYTVYVLLDDAEPLEAKLLELLANGKGEFIPYFGKNDHQLWWDNFEQYSFEVFKPEKPYKVSTLLRKVRVLKNIQSPSQGRISFSAAPVGSDFFMFFERLPIGFDEQIGNYRLEEFVFTNRTFPASELFEGLYLLKETQVVVQLL